MVLRSPPMTTDAKAAVPEQLQMIATDLEGVWFRLLGMQASLPPPQEGDLEEDAVPDLRDVIHCVIADSIVPAIHDLKAAVADLARKAGG